MAGVNDVPETAMASTPASGPVFDCADPEVAQEAIMVAADTVRGGSLVVLPTDTVYGIGANAFLPAAVQGLLEAKGRGRDMPPPVLIADASVLMALGRDIPEAAKKLAETFWPGALTLIVHAQPSLRMDLGDTAGTIAVRVPDHDLARELLRSTGPLAVSSANRSGAPPAVTAQEARDQLGEWASVYLDAGPTPGQVPSTIVDFTVSDYGVIVRRGLLDLETLREVVPYLEDTEPEEPAEPEPMFEEAEPMEPESVDGQAGPTEPDLAQEPLFGAEEAEPATDEASEPEQAEQAVVEESLPFVPGPELAVPDAGDEAEAVEPEEPQPEPEEPQPEPVGWDAIITPPEPGDKAG